jgi:hypothetical protein
MYCQENVIVSAVTCCNSLVLSYDHCLDCYYDGYDGIYSKQDQFYFNIQKNLVFPWSNIILILILVVEKKIYWYQFNLKKNPVFLFKVQEKAFWLLISC